MSQDPAPGTPSGSLPSFSSPSSLPSFSGGPSQPSFEPDEQTKSRTRAIMLTVIVSSVALLCILALVLWLTVFRSPDPEDLIATGPTAQGGSSSTAEGEYIPDPNDPNLAPPPPIFTQAPTTSCYIPEYSGQGSSSSGGVVRGGHLEYTRPDKWTMPWGFESLPYMSDVDGYARNVEGSWYSVVSVGEVDWPDSEGGYPGMEDTAVAIFQCYATTSGVREYFGEHPTVTDYRSEATTVDGHSAWIVQATYHFENPDMLSDSSASVVTSIVVETEDGPQALASDVAADVPAHVEDLEEIIASLKVV